MYLTSSLFSLGLLYLSFSGILCLYYIYIIGRYIEGWSALPQWFVPQSFRASQKVSILVPARNEEDYIAACIQSILHQNYPAHLIEVVVIDDHSTDATVSIIQGINDVRVKVLHLADFIEESSSSSFKKRAIETGMQAATGSLILTTDADCIVKENWLSLITSFYEYNNLKFVAAPVNFFKEKNLLEKFQSLDFLGMMCVTGAGIHRRFMNMCNGANLAYSKETFYEVNGFEGIDQVASGDDMLLMQKIAKRFPDQIGYLKNNEATVCTEAKPTLKTFTDQRIRWASKSNAYKEWKVTFILAMVFFFCCNIILSFLLIPFVGWTMFWLFGIQVLIKGVMDFFFLRMMCHFFDRKDLMRVFLPSLFMHIVYIAIIGTMGNLVKEYEWKGRKTT